MVILLGLAIAGLVVGVSNDAVNFMNSAIGSKAAPRKYIVLIAGIGILAGVTISSGMMEVARKGIFNPEYFVMPELMIIFLAVMLQNIILLDLFNTFGLPTSTTVSVVFGLFGGALALAAIKIGTEPEIIWESDYYLSDISSPVAYNGLLFLATSYGALVCHDALTGDVYWEQEFDNGFYSSPMIVEGNVYLMDTEGNLIIFKADKEFSVIAESSIGETAMTTPAFKDGKIFIRSNDNLFCIGSE